MWKTVGFRFPNMIDIWWIFHRIFHIGPSKASRPLPAPPGCHSTVPNPFEDRRAQDIPRQMINTCRPGWSGWSGWSGWRLQDPIPLFAAQSPVFVVLPLHFLWWIVPLFEWFAQCWVGRRYHYTLVRRAMTWTVGVKLYDMTDMAYQNLVGDRTTLIKATCLPLWICWIIPTQTKRFLLAPTINLFWGTRNHHVFIGCQAATLGNLKYDWHAKLPQSWSQHRYRSATSSQSASPQSHR